MPLRSTARTSLVGLVIEQLEALIAGGEWPVGTKIPPEPALVEQLDVGRNTVREAVRALVHTGLLEARQGDGTYVRARSDFGAAVQRRLRRAENLEAYEVRAALERDAARHAAVRRTPADLAALRESLAERVRTWESGDTDAFVAADVRFHQLIAQAAHNGVLSDLYAHLSDALRATLYAVLAAHVPDGVHHQLDGHTAVVDAIEAGDADAAERAVLAHLTEARDALRDASGDGARAGGRPHTTGEHRA